MEPGASAFQFLPMLISQSAGAAAKKPFYTKQQINFYSSLHLHWKRTAVGIKVPAAAFC
jgi:hypothetical protein